MSRGLVVLLIACLLLPSSMRAQQAGPALAAEGPFEAWQPATLSEPVAPRGGPLSPVGEGSKDRFRNALLGGAIGTGAGLVFCTIVSNLVNEGTGFSTCTAKGYLLTGGVGFGLGFLVGLGV